MQRHTIPANFGLHKKRLFFCVLAVESIAYSSINVTWDKNET